MTLDDNQVMCDAEGCGDRGDPFRSARIRATGATNQGVDDGCGDDDGIVTHFCPDHCQQFHG
jgi:hypothetical protein